MTNYSTVWSDGTATSGPNTNISYGIPPTFTNNTCFHGEISATDVNIDGVSMKKLMKNINDRLAILDPDPEKLKKFVALQDLYEQYKIMEALCSLDDGQKDDK